MNPRTAQSESCGAHKQPMTGLNQHSRTARFESCRAWFCTFDLKSCASTHPYMLTGEAKCPLISQINSQSLTSRSPERIQLSSVCSSSFKLEFTYLEFHRTLAHQRWSPETSQVPPLLLYSGQLHNVFVIQLL